MTLFEAVASASDGPPDPHSASQQALAAELDRRLADLATLEDRIAAIRAAIDGTVSFSTSLGIEDQAITHAIAATGTAIDIFTLDTGRHFPETLDTLFDTEGKYGLKIRVMYPDAAEVEELVANDGIYGFRYSVEARKACCEIRKVRPLNRALKGCCGLDHGPTPRAVARPRACSVRELRRGAEAYQSEPDRRLGPRATRRLHRRQ